MILYYITDRHALRDRPLLTFLRDAIEAGIEMIQIREKDLDTRSLLSLARTVSDYAAASRTEITINDRLDVAMSAGAQGVHLGSHSLPIAKVRSLAPQGFLIGASCHSVSDVLRAEAAGASYALLGPIFDTPSKRAYGLPLGLQQLEEAASKANLPVYALGGITIENCRECLATGARGVAAIRMFQDAASLAGRVRELRALIE